MRVLKPVKQIDFRGRYTLLPNVSYVFSGRQAQEIERIASNSRGGPSDVIMDPVRIEWVYQEYHGQDLTNKTLFLWRTGGAGDLIGLKIPIQYAKKRWPSCKIVLACDPNYAPIFDGDPNIDEIRSYPVRLDWLKEADYHLCFEALIEDNEDAKRIHMADLFLNKFGFKGLDASEKVPLLPVSSLAIKQTDALFAQAGFNPLDFTVGIQLIVDAPIRKYPPSHLAVVGKELVENHDAKIVWIGSKHHIQDIDQIAINRYHLARNSINLPKHKECQTWQHTAAVVAKCDLIISADSGTLHVAGANKVVIDEAGAKAHEFSKYQFGFDAEINRTHTPQVGIYGPFWSHQRQKYYGDAVGIDTEVMCAGCNQHGYAPCRRSGGGISPCFQVIEFSLVAQTAMQLAYITNQRRAMPKPISNTTVYETASVDIRTQADQPPMEFHRAPNYMDAILKQDF